jgi:hypothetical protein
MIIRTLVQSFLGLLLLAPVSVAQQKAQTAEASDARAVETAMKNVTYHYSDSVTVHIIRLQGYLQPVKSGGVVVFDDKNSFDLQLTSAEISISCNALAAVLNESVFSTNDAPIKNVSIEGKDDQLYIKGKLPQKAGIAFETIGTLSVDSDGRIRLRTDHVKAAHVPVKGLMDLLGIDIARVIDTHKVRGVTVDKDDLILDPELIMPAPHIRGKVTAVRLRGNDIVQVFGGEPGPSFAAKLSGNYMAFRHSDMRFGKLTMHDADLIMIDMDPGDPFDFYLDHYQEQLVAGYSKSTSEYGLRVYTRDYEKLRKRSRGRPQTSHQDTGHQTR